MPSYTFRCDACGELLTHVSSIRDYITDRPTFIHCGAPMDRFFEVVPALAINNPGAGDRHYDGLRAPDGTDISSRSKHREYMRANNLTTADDFTQTWARAAEQRAATLAGQDATRGADIAQAIAKLGG
jgi:predicted nucleic acid-binding Zn ribbon protein